MRRSAGFTLLEILAALAIAVVGISAVVQTMGGAVDILQTSEDRTLGSWVAGNHLSELKLSRQWPGARTRDVSVDLGGRRWFIREEISTTSDPELLRVDLDVYSDKDQELLVSTVFGYLARYSPPTTKVIPGGQLETVSRRANGQSPEESVDQPVEDGDGQSQQDSLSSEDSPANEGSQNPSSSSGEGNGVENPSSSPGESNGEENPSYDTDRSIRS